MDTRPCTGASWQSSSGATPGPLIPSDPLAPLRLEPARSAVLLDFDGTLAPIVARPEDARPMPGAREAVAALIPRFALVAVITGRPAEEVRQLLGVDGVQYAGLYGLEEASIRALDASALWQAVETLAAGVLGAWVEPKGLSLAVHYRQARDPTAAAEVLRRQLSGLTAGSGFEVIAGKMVLELVPAGESRKGGAVTRLATESGSRAVLYAGDDLPDLEAFAALDALAVSGVSGVKVAVGGAEAPPELMAAADLRVEGPADLVRLLWTLA
jgi:trehalose 6-phosphate phosphatase